MKFEPTKKLLTALLTVSLLLSATACNTADLEIPLPTSADSTIESTKTEILTEETTEKTPSDIIIPEGAIKTEINDHYTEYRIPYDNGSTGFIYYYKEWNAYSLEFTVKTSEIRSVTLIQYDLITCPPPMFAMLKDALKQNGLDDVTLLVTATHCHTAPEVRIGRGGYCEDYLPFAVEKTLEACKEARQEL